MKTLKNLISVIEESSSVQNSRAVISSDQIYCQLILDDGSITLLKNGSIVYKSQRRSTAFKLSDCLNFKYRTADGGTVLTYEYFADLDWTVWALLYGEERIESTVNHEYSRRVIGLRSAESSRQMSYLTDKQEEEFVDYAPSAEEIVIETDSFEELIAPLNKRYQDVCRKHYLGKLSIAEIAQQYNCSYHTAEMVLSRAKKQLKKKLSGHA